MSSLGNNRSNQNLIYLEIIGDCLAEEFNIAQENNGKIGVFFDPAIKPADKDFILTNLDGRYQICQYFRPTKLDPLPSIRLIGTQSYAPALKGLPILGVLAGTLEPMRNCRVDSSEAIKGYAWESTQESRAQAA